MVRNLKTSADPNVDPFAPRSSPVSWPANIARRIGRMSHRFTRRRGRPTFRSDSELRVLCVSVVIFSSSAFSSPSACPSFQFCNVRARDSSVRLAHSAQSNQPK